MALCDSIKANAKTLYIIGAVLALLGIVLLAVSSLVYGARVNACTATAATATTAAIPAVGPPTGATWVCDTTTTTPNATMKKSLMVAGIISLLLGVALGGGAFGCSQMK